MSALFGIPGISWGEAEAQFIEILSDGKPHHLSEFTVPLCNNENAAKFTIKRIRIKLEQFGSGYEIVSIYKSRRCYYRLMRTVSLGD